jgi:hypothetical protein
VIIRPFTISGNEVIIVAVFVFGRGVLVPELSNSFEFIASLWTGKWVMAKYSFEIWGEFQRSSNSIVSLKDIPRVAASHRFKAFRAIALRKRALVITGSIFRAIVAAHSTSSHLKMKIQMVPHQADAFLPSYSSSLLKAAARFEKRTGFGPHCSIAEAYSLAAFL